MPGMIYALVTRIAAPVLRIWLRLRAARGKEIVTRLAERRGLDSTARPAGRLLWLHAASVGEAMSVLPVVAALQGSAEVLLTTGTVTSARLLADRLQTMPHARHRFVPLDVPAWATRFLDHWRPDAACFVESEIWPNLLRACHARGIPTVLVNTRLSARSFASWRRVPRWAATLFGQFAWIQARSEDDAARLRALGGRNVTAPGDLKFAAPDLPADAARLQALRPNFATGHAWLAASTHSGEERIIAAVHAALLPRFPDLLTVIVPRHPDRGVALAQELHAARYGAGDTPRQGLWIVDTVGDLGLFYRLCDVVFVGKSLLPPGGGQNPLEAARLGCAIAMGPFTQNFDAATRCLRDGGALEQVADADELARFVAHMLTDHTERTRRADAARHALADIADLPRRVASALRGTLGLQP